MNNPIFTYINSIFKPSNLFFMQTQQKTKKSASFFLSAFLIGFLLMISISSCEEKATDAELKEVMFTAEDVKKCDSTMQKYVGKTLEEINTIENRPKHSRRKTRKLLTDECNPFGGKK